MYLSYISGYITTLLILKNWIISLPMRVSGNGYIAVGQQMLWSNAQSYCQSTYGTSLATIVSAEENAAVRSTADSGGLSGQSIWIGLHDMGTEDSFEWQDGTGYANNYYTNWYPNEPNDSGSNEDCTEMGSSGQWNDHVCSTQSRYFVFRWQ